MPSFARPGSRDGRAAPGDRDACRKLPPALTLFLSLLLTPFVAYAAAPGLGPVRDPGEMGAGGFLIRADAGLREAPLLETDVAIEVAGLIARTRVTQRFTNPTGDWVEGIYVFPLPEGAAVDTLTMRIGERVIAGRVEETARAKQTYEKAKSEGRKASLVEQERPNVFTTSIANLGPDETLEITIAYQENAQYDRGRFSLRFPLVVGPRFIPGRPSRSASTGPAGARTPTRSRTPRASPRRSRSPGTDARTRWCFAPRSTRASPSIRSRARATRPGPCTAGGVYAIRLDDPDARADRDFVLEWVPAVGRAPSAALFRESVEGDEYALLMVLPPPVETKETRVSRETIIVIDTSGSMSGESIVQARRAVGEALSTLRPEDAFNVIEFDSTFEMLFPASRPATPEAVSSAKRWVDSLDADGGTNMLPALVAALQPGGESRAVRQIVFVTDGAVGNEDALFGAIERHLGRSRPFTVGIGSAPNGHFMSEAAEYGRGTFTYIGNPAEVAPRMAALFEKIDSPVLHDLRVDSGGATVESWPRESRTYTRASRSSSPLACRRRPGGSSSPGGAGARTSVSISTSRAVPTTRGVSRLWARRKVAGLMDSSAKDAPSTTSPRRSRRSAFDTSW